jgi:hypothetical protein
LMQIMTGTSYKKPLKLDSSLYLHIQRHGHSFLLYVICFWLYHFVLRAVVCA